MENVMLFMVAVAAFAIIFSLWTTYKEKKELGL